MPSLSMTRSMSESDTLLMLTYHHLHGPVDRVRVWSYTKCLQNCRQVFLIIIPFIAACVFITITYRVFLCHYTPPFMHPKTLNNNATQKLRKGEETGVCSQPIDYLARFFTRSLMIWLFDLANVEDISMSLVREFLSIKKIIFMPITSVHVRYS